MLKQRGFTLIETVIFIMVMGIALSGIVSLFVQSAVGGRYPFEQQRAIALANTYMDEILRKRWNESVPFGGGCVETGSLSCNNYCAARPYPDCRTCLLDTVNSVCVAPAAAASGVDTGETRATFDDIDDYDGLSNPTPVNAAGTAIAGYAGYSVAVSVTSPAAGTLWNGVPALDTKEIIVTVTVGADSYALTAYRVNH